MLVVAALLAFPSSAAARIIKVRNQHNAGPGSLRSALGKAHAGDGILVPAGTYKLKSQLFIRSGVDVVGAGATKTILTAGHKSRVLDVNNAAADVTLERLAITHGRAQTGGGILNVADLKLTHVRVSANLAAGGVEENIGGGIANSGELTLIHSEISDNKTAPGRAEGWGAGIADGVTGGGALDISRSSLTGNVAQGQGFGGALFFAQANPPFNGGDITISTSTITNNKVLGNEVEGGAIFYHPTDDTGSLQVPLTLTRDTFSGNVADGGSTEAIGGALYYGPVSSTPASFPLTMVNDTFVGNRAGNSRANGIGGAFDFVPALNKGAVALTLTNLTIARNRADGPNGSGGGVVYAPTGNLSGTFVNSIIALNTAASGPDCFPSVPSGGHNIERHESCDFSNSAGDMQDTDPLLGRLGDNGGPTKTLALLPGSPAIDAGSDMACPSIDQRGVSRPQGPHCDIGAFERQH